MLSKRYEVTESEDGTIETFCEWTVRVSFMHGDDADAYTKNELGFSEKSEALEWYALWSGLSKLPRCYDGVTAYARWILNDIEREKALFFFNSPDKQSRVFIEEYFIADKDAFSDRYEERLHEVEDTLMNHIDTDNQSYGDLFAKIDTVELLYFDKETSQRKEMSVSYG